MSSHLFPDSTATGVAAIVDDGRQGEITTIPLIEESAVVGKRLLDQGGFRISKQVLSRQETVDEPLASQQVSVERRAIGQLLLTTEPPTPRLEGNTWVIPVVEEVLVTEKRLRLIEEIRITRKAMTNHQPQQVTLRSEQITIERLEPGDPPDTGSL